MINRPNNKLLLIIIGILLVTNIAMLFFFIKGKPADRRGMRAERRAMMSAFLQKEIGFSTAQLTQFDSLSEQHWRKMRPMFDKARKEKEQLFKELAADDFSDSSINRKADIAAGEQKQIEAGIFSHYRNVRNLCTPEQLPRFDSLFYGMLNRRPDDKKK